MFSYNICVLKNQALALLIGFLMAVVVRAENSTKQHIRTDVKRGAARAAVLESETRHSSAAFTVAEVEPNNTPQEAQALTGASPLVVNGNTEVSDQGQLIFDDDDIEDLFRVTTTASGINIRLDNFSSDCDLWLIDSDDLSDIDWSLNIGATGSEVIDNAGLPAGSYFIGVTIFDADPAGPDNTPYELTITGKFGGNTPGATPIGTLAYHQITSFSESQVAGQGWQHVLSDNGGHVVWYKQRNPKGVFTANADGSNIREVANLGTGRLSSVDISADGSRIAYLGGGSGSQLNSVNADGSNDRALLTLSALGIGTLRLTGDGSKIFFNLPSAKRIQGSGDLIEAGVYSINFDGRGLQQVVGPASVAGLMGIAASDVRFGSTRLAVDPSFDGARVIFSAKKFLTSEYHVFLANGDGSGVRRLFGSESTINVGMSRNGEKVAFLVTRASIREGYTSNFDGSQLRKIASNEQFTFAGAFGNDVGDQISLTADGSKVIFHGKFGYLFNSDGSGVVQLSANSAAPAGMPLIVGSLARATMSSDGSRVLFSFIKSNTIPPGSRWQLATLDINPASLGAAPALTDITVNPAVVALNGASNATIHAKVNPANNVSYVGNVALLNGLRDFKVTNRTFFDDGVSAGDAVAGDGIFTHNAIQAFADAEIGPRILRINAEVFSADGRLHGTAVAVTPFAVVQSPPTSVETPDGNVPNTFSLNQNYPNPFNPETRISFNLPNSANIRLVVFNLLGQQIRTLIHEKKHAGRFSVVWDGRMDNGQQAASGVYIYRLQAERFVQSRKLLLLR